MDTNRPIIIESIFEDKEDKKESIKEE